MPDTTTTSIQSFEDLVSVSDIEKTYRSLAPMEVELDDDPLAYGPKRLNLKTSEVRRCLSQLERSFSEWSRQRATLNRRVIKISALIEQKMQDLMENDPLVRSGSSRLDREDRANRRMREEVSEKTRLEEAINEIDSLLVVIKAKRADLKDVSGRIKDQLKICQEELGLGARWGSRLPANAASIELVPGLGAGMLDTAQDLDSELESLIAVEESDERSRNTTPAWMDEEPVAEEVEEAVETSEEEEPEILVSQEVLGDGESPQAIEAEVECLADEVGALVSEPEVLVQDSGPVEPEVVVPVEVKEEPKLDLDFDLGALLSDEPPAVQEEEAVVEVTVPAPEEKEECFPIPEVTEPEAIVLEEPPVLVADTAPVTEAPLSPAAEVEALFLGVSIPSGDFDSVQDHPLDSLLAGITESKSTDKVASAVDSFGLLVTHDEEIINALTND